MRDVILGVALVSCFACSPSNRGRQASTGGAADPPVDSASSLAGLDRAEQAFLAAYARKDVDGVLALYTDDSHFVANGRVLEGKEAMRKPWERSFQTLTGLKLTPIVRRTQGDLGVSLERFTQQDREPGKPAVTDSGYSMAVLRRQPDGRWLYQAIMLSRPPAQPTAMRSK
jgi:uncharacterized protein (TIGR02246 family)